MNGRLMKMELDGRINKKRNLKNHLKRLEETKQDLLLYLTPIFLLEKG